MCFKTKMMQVSSTLEGYRRTSVEGNSERALLRYSLHFEVINRLTTIVRRLFEPKQVQFG